MATFDIIHRITNHGRAAVVEEVHADFADFVFAVFQNKLLCVGELADDGGFDAFRGTQSFELGPVFLGHRQHHSLLSF